MLLGRVFRSHPMPNAVHKGWKRWKRERHHRCTIMTFGNEGSNNVLIRNFRQLP